MAGLIGRMTVTDNDWGKRFGGRVLGQSFASQRSGCHLIYGGGGFDGRQVRFTGSERLARIGFVFAPDRLVCATESDMWGGRLTVAGIYNAKVGIVPMVVLEVIGAGSIGVPFLGVCGVSGFSLGG